MDELKAEVEQLAKEDRKTELEIITELQAGAVQMGDFRLLEALCKLKWDYISY